MALLVANCPRCGAEEMSFQADAVVMTERAGWMQLLEAFCICRRCELPTIFQLMQKSDEHNSFCHNKDSILRYEGALNFAFEVMGFVSVKDRVKFAPPEHLPPDIEDAFREASVCMSVECWNAAGAMFRTCIDIATKGMLLDQDLEGLNNRVRRTLVHRLTWLFANAYLPSDLEDFSECIREDGNDAVHDGNLTKDDAEDLLDFTMELLRRVYTEPGRIAQARARRMARRNPE